MKTTESAAEIIIVFVLIAAFLAGLFASILWVIFQSLLWTGIIGGIIFVIDLAFLFGNYAAHGERL